MIELGRKYALIAVNEGFPGQARGSETFELAPGIAFSNFLPLELPEHWERWIGEIRAEAIRSAGIFLAASAPSASLGVLDRENQVLVERVQRVYWGLLVASGPLHHKEAFWASGAVTNAGASVRTAGHLAPIYRTAGAPLPPINRSRLQVAARIGETMDRHAHDGSHGRLRRMFRAYYSGLQAPALQDRLHQSVRVLDGFFASAPGRGRKEFSSRLGEICVPNGADLGKDLYEIRGEVEHLRDPLTKIPTDVEEGRRLEFLARYTHVAETVARSVLEAVFMNDELQSFFADSSDPAEFWKLSEDERIRLLGPPINLKRVSALWAEDEFDRLTEVET